MLHQITVLRTSTTGKCRAGQGRPSYGGMTHVASLKFQGGGELLKILHNVMQRPVGHVQRAYSTNML